MILEGTYASYKLSKDSAKKLEDWMKESEIVEPVPIEDLHVTTTYSTKNVDLVPSEKTIVLKKEDYSITTYGRALVLAVKSDELQKIHAAALEAGANYSYESYKPHITISYNAEANDNILPLLMNPTFDITLSHEVVEPLTEEQERMISERYGMAAIYDFWGWIKPNGSLLLPNKEMRDSLESIYHIDLLNWFDKTKSDYGHGFKDNMIRFYLRKGKLFFELSWITPVKVASAGYRNIEKYLATKKKELQSLFGKSDLAILDFQYELDRYVDGSWSYYSSGYNLKSLLRDLEENNQRKLNEYFEMAEHYKFWGWIKPSGALLLPTLEMKNSEDIQFNHEKLIRNFNPELRNYDDAYNIGMIRFLIDNNNKLYFDVPSICKPSTIRIGYSNIENYIMKNTDKLKNIFNSKISRIHDFNYSIMKKIKKSWGYGYYGTDSVNSLIDRIRNQNLEDKIKEETPANSTVNVAGYDKPLKTFKMFRRKPINLN